MILRTYHLGHFFSQKRAVLEPMRPKPGDHPAVAAYLLGEHGAEGHGSGPPSEHAVSPHVGQQLVYVFHVLELLLDAVKLVTGGIAGREPGAAK